MTRRCAIATRHNVDERLHRNGGTHPPLRAWTGPIRSELRKASVASPPVRWARAAAVDRADWRWRRPYWWRFEDIGLWCSDFDGRATTEWSAHRCPLRANGQQRRGVVNAV